VSAFLESLTTRAKARDRRIVFPEGSDDRTLEAVARITLAQLVRPVVLGRPDPVRHAVHRLGGDADAVEVRDPVGDPAREALAIGLAEARAHKGLTQADAFALLEDPLLFAGMLVRFGQADGCVAGAINTTADVLRAALWTVGTSPGIKTVSSSFYMVVPAFRGTAAPEVLTFTDAGVVPTPTVEQHADIAAAAADARGLIVEDSPRVAFLSFSTHGSAAGPEVDRVRAGLERFRTLRPDVPADGELQADAALIETVARRKAPDSALHGDANVLVFPDLDAGNIAYKLVQRLARAEAIGPILQGLDRPCSDLSRGASPEDIVNVACITALQS
jgi:phosphate acetyltransferase